MGKKKAKGSLGMQWFTTGVSTTLVLILLGIVSFFIPVSYTHLLCSLNLKEQHEKAFYRDLRLPDERGRQRSSGFGDAYGWIRDVRNLG